MQVPRQRQGDARQDGAVGQSQTAERRTKRRRRSGSPIGARTGATLAAGPDGALWVTVDGADVQQLAARISAVCDVLIPAQPPHPWRQKN